MILFWLIALPALGGVFALLAGRRSPEAARWISIAALAAGFALAIPYLGRATETGWLAEFSLPWIPRLGISFHLAMDGLSLLLVLLTYLLGILSVVVSWRSIDRRVGFFHFNMLWILTGTIGVFIATDLFLFFFFWELMVLPMFLVIGIWGHENRNYAAIKFFIFTQASGLLLLVAIVGLAFAHFHTTGVLTFHYDELLGAELTAVAQMWLMLGFFVAFAVKVPAFPFHTWLADAHSEAPTGGSVILAGVLLKTGGYGLIRFVVPLFPEASAAFAPYAMAMGVAGILYGAKLAFAQSDLKRLIAYTSISHMGFILLGVFSWNELALQGSVVQMICHGFSTGALFILAGCLYDRIHTRDLSRMGGFRDQAPRMAALGLFFAMASLGLPGLGNFIGEFLVLVGAFQASVPLTVLATLGVVAAAVYSLWIVQRVFHGTPHSSSRITDLNLREFGALAVLLIGLLWFGLYPKPLLDTADKPLRELRNHASERFERATELRRHGEAVFRIPDPGAQTHPVRRTDAPETHRHSAATIALP